MGAAVCARPVNLRPFGAGARGQLREKSPCLSLRFQAVVVSFCCSGMTSPWDTHNLRLVKKTPSKLVFQKSTGSLSGERTQARQGKKGTPLYRSGGVEEACT